MWHLITGCIFFSMMQLVMAVPIIKPSISLQPTSCVKTQFSQSSGHIKITLTNRCRKPIDLNNAVVTFENRSDLHTSFSVEELKQLSSHEDMAISSTKKAQNFQANIPLRFQASKGKETILPEGKSVSISYATDKADYLPNSAEVYLGTQGNTATVEIALAQTKPANVTQNYATMHLRWNNYTISNFNLPWGYMAIFRYLAPGTYTVLVDNVRDTSGAVYQGTATPSTFSLYDYQRVRSYVKYAIATSVQGKLSIRLSALPSQLYGYSSNPSAHVVESATGIASVVNLAWGQTATASNLKSGSTYYFTTPDISYNGYLCKGVFTPTTLVASSTTLPLTTLSYSCTQTNLANVSLKITGAPTSVTSVTVNFIPNNNTSQVSQTVSLSNGTGSHNFQLPAGVIYNVSAQAISGYNISYNPQPFTAQANAIETVSYSQQTTGTTPVQANGQLKVCGTQLCNQHGTPIQLKGMSTHGLQWFGLGKCITSASLDALARDFKASVIRLSLYVQEGGYETNPTGYTQQMNSLIDQATARGLYVIVDWHMLEPGDPNYNLARAKQFFTAVATAHPNNNNLLYEIANEPSGVSWDTIKNYANQLIPVIRAVDNRSPIIVGTVGWSSLGVSEGRTSQDIINSPINFPNILYTFHFYAASHKDAYLQELDRASRVLPIFVTEFGTQEYTGDGPNDFTMSTRYMTLMAERKIGWTNWNYSDDFRSGAIWTTGTCPNGPWTDSRLKPAGVYIKDKIRN